MRLPIALAMILSAVTTATAQDDHTAGLLAAYRADRSDKIVRGVDPAIAFDWQTFSPDVRISSGRFTAEWTGLLQVRSQGTYRFSVHLTGRVTLRVDGKTIIEDAPGENGWVVSPPVKMDYGFHPIEVRFAKIGDAARIGLFWSCESFDREPVPPRDLFHKTSAGDVSEAQLQRFERGRRLADAYRCLNCHDYGPESKGFKAPALTKLAGTVEREWLARHIQSPRSIRRDSKMPTFDIAEQQAGAIADFLLLGPPKAKPVKVDAGDAKAGQTLLRSVGCLACHRVNEIGAGGLYTGPDLSRIAGKRSPAALATWLTDPEQINPDHRMPTFTLSDKQRSDLVAYLSSLGEPAGTSAPMPNTREARMMALLVGQLRCAACHRIGSPRGRGFFVEKVGPVRGQWERGCTATAARKNPTQPYYVLSDEDRQALREYFSQVPSEFPKTSTADFGRVVTDRANCLGCHQRDAAPGLLPVVGKLQGVDGLPQRSRMIPPSLNTIGDKLTDKELLEAVVGGRKTRRPWLTVRMPRFRHPPGHAEAIRSCFVARDRVPIAEGPPENPPAPQALRLAGHALVGAAGFGCMTCHDIGTYKPLNVALGARGPDLRHMDARIRPQWHRRWLKNPARIVPGVEMPAVIVPAPKILGENLAHQVEAVWTALNAETFSVPPAVAVQTLIAKAGEPPILMRDCLEHPQPRGDRTIRSLGIGFANRQNILFDFDALSLTRWWIGHFARQTTRGKTWFWVTGGIDLLNVKPAGPYLALKRSGTLEVPESLRGTIARLRGFGRDAETARFSYGVTFGGTERIEVTETLTAGGPTGIIRRIEATGVPAGATLLFVQPRGNPVLERDGSARLSADTAVGSAVIELGDSRAWTPAELPIGKEKISAFTAPFEPADPPNEKTASLRLTYTGPKAPPSPGLAPSVYEPVEQKTLPVLPGYEVTRLAVTNAIMPTGFAWRADGRLLVSSLKGRVFLAEDRDADSFEDTLKPFSPHLAAPYGLLSYGPEIFVAHKPELLRLVDLDGDDFAERAEVVVDGWGFTFDYHDWTIGPVRDSAGNMYFATAVQQDERPVEAAHLRGRVLKLDPSGRLTEVATGLRFPMGLALDASDNLFVSDNQGRQNTYNEINHVMPGRYYGFPNRHDAFPDDPPEPTDPAVRVPHPWTRSVNGIAFVPAGETFGPFGGHLIGAEINTKRLVRFSLQKVGATFQGATYPFSRFLKDRPDDNFLGPLALAFSPKGDLYVGSVLDSGWGGGNNRGEICKIRYVGPVPAGIQEVRAHRGGFTIDFTGPVDPKKAADPKSYTISAATRRFQGAYASPDRDVTRITVSRATVSADDEQVVLTASPLKPGYLYAMQLSNLTPDGSPFHPAEAYYTLNEIPDVDP